MGLLGFDGSSKRLGCKPEAHVKCDRKITGKNILTNVFGAGTSALAFA